MASHPLVVGVAGVLGFILPAPLRAILPRGLDVTLRGSIFRTGVPSSSTRRRRGHQASGQVGGRERDCIGKRGRSARR